MMNESTIYGDYTIEMMGEWLAMYRRWGEIRAKINWVGCCDPDGKTNRHKILVGYERTLIKKIRTFRANLVTILDDIDIEALRIEGMRECDDVMDRCEAAIEREFRPFDLNFNEKAIIVRSKENIPEDILMGLSFGWKFLFPYITTNSNIHSVLAQMDHCVESSVPEVFQQETFKRIAHILANRTRVQHDINIQWLRFVHMRSRRFFAQNKGIFATKSDKGGHTVVVDLHEYEFTLANMLGDSSYEKLKTNPLRSMVRTEQKLLRFCQKNKKIYTVEQTRKFIRGYEPLVIQLAKFYGLPKVHKDVFCLRPILAMSGAPGFAAGKIFDIMLNRIFPRNDLHIKDSYDAKKFFDNVNIKDNDRLVSFDVVSMFTSIPTDLAKKLLLRKADDFLHHFGMGKSVLDKFMEFLLNECTVFTALNDIYRQKQGLPMGSCISPTIARVVMDEIIKFVLARVTGITFIKVFVDDTIAALRGDIIEETLMTLNSFEDGIKFTLERENANGALNFLNLTLIRDGTSILTNWYRKSFASGRLVNYFSSHKRTTVVETAKNFIRTVIELSDGSFFHTNRVIVSDTLRDNNFPETLIITLLNECYTMMRAKKPSIDEEKDYRIYPHAVCESRRIKSVIHEMKHRDVSLAESTKNTKINSVTTRKTITPILKRGNSVISAKCQCGQKYKCVQTGFNENVEIAIRRRMFTLHRRCKNGMHSFRSYNVHRGLAYKSQTKYLARYIQWKFAGKYLNTNVGRPQHHFTKLLNKGNPTGVKISL